MKCKNTKYPVILAEFKNLRKYIKLETKNQYKFYCAQIEQNIKENPSNFWQFIDGKKNNQKLPNAMEYKEVEYNNLAVISSASFFILKFFCKKFSVSEIETALKRIKPKNTLGPDRIPAFLLRDCATVQAPPLSCLFNLSLKNGIFLSILKNSRIIPVYKKINSVENYQ